MNNSIIQEIKMSIFMSLRKAAMFIFVFITLYTPVTVLLSPPEMRHFGIELQVIIVFSVFTILLSFFRQNSVGM